MATTTYTIQPERLIWQKFAATAPRQFVEAVEIDPDATDEISARWADTLYAEFDIPDAARRRAITKMEIRAEMGALAEKTAVHARLLSEAFDAAAIAAGETIGADGETVTASVGVVPLTEPIYTVYQFGGYTRVADVLNGIALTNDAQPVRAGSGERGVRIVVNSWPQIQLVTEDAILRAQNVTPGGGSYVDRAAPCVVSWTPMTDAVTLEAPVQASAVIRWKEGAEGTVHTRSVTTDTSVTFAANTFPLSTDIWLQITVTSGDGVTDPAAPWIRMRTIDSTPTATPTAPRGVYVTDAADVTFAWDYSVSTGAAQSAFETQIRAQGAGSWSTLYAAQSADTSFEYAIEQLPTGVVEWRVRAANQSGVYSEWSAPAMFVLMAAPAAPQVTVTRQTPAPLISWSAEAQLAYRIEILRGAEIVYASGAVYGTEKSAEPPVLLDDGAYTARVQIGASTGLWSEWGAAEFRVVNTPGASAPVVAANDGANVSLYWQPVSGFARYDIIRDGQKIGETNGTSYVDRVHLGTASYVVRGVMADGNYTPSDPVTATAAVGGVMIAAYDGGEWLDIGLSASETPQTAETLSASVTLQTISGAVYPAVERAPFRGRSYSVAFATTDAATGRAFEALISEIVIVKDQYGTVIVGMLSEIAKAQNTFMAAYSATVTEVDPDA